MSSNPRTPGASLEDTSLNSSFSLLADETRRQLLRVLTDTETPISLPDLAHRLAARTAEGNPPEDRIKRLRTTLHHVHLPKLQQENVLEYDPDHQTVTPGKNLSETLAILHATTD